MPTRCKRHTGPPSIEGSLQPTATLNVPVVVLCVEGVVVGHQVVVEQPHALAHPVRAKARESKQPLVPVEHRAWRRQACLTAAKGQRALVKQLHADGTIAVQFAGKGAAARRRHHCRTAAPLPVPTQRQKQPERAPLLAAPQAATPSRQL